jgi:hypothetical protein
MTSLGGEYQRAARAAIRIRVVNDHVGSHPVLCLWSVCQVSRSGWSQQASYRVADLESRQENGQRSYSIQCPLVPLTVHLPPPFVSNCVEP